MLPGPLVGLYQQYKKDTDAVASWLASIAKAIGYSPELLASKSWNAGVPNKGGGRLKGKERKEAKARAATKSTASKYLVALRDFVPLAQSIANHKKPPVTVPNELASTLDRLILCRSSFGTKMEDHGVVEDIDSDNRHLYFVEVLESVREALRPRMRVDTAAASATRKTDVDTANAQTDTLPNRFESLNVEEPSKGFLEAWDNNPERPKARDDDPVVYEAEPATSPDDIMFAFTILMKDLENIRYRVKWIWHSHRLGRLELGASAVATDIAISLARGIIDDVAPLFDRYEGGIWAVFNNFFLTTCLGNGFTTEEVYTGGEDSLNTNLYDVADSTCYISYRLLLGFLKDLSPTAFSVQEDTIGPDDISSDRGSKTRHEKFLEDQALLLGFLPDLVIVTRYIGDYPVEDEFMRGMREVDKTHKLSLSLVFAAQIFLDIHHTMRDAIYRSAETLARHTASIRNSLDTHLEFHKDLKVSNWPAKYDDRMRTFIQRIDWMDGDPVYQANLVFHRAKGVDASRQTRHRFMTFSPVLSGLYLFSNQNHAYDLGISAADAWGSIQVTAHLYNALKQEKMLQVSWPDQDVALTLLGDESIWVGGIRPDNPGDYLKKHYLQSGMSATAVVANPAFYQGKMVSRAGGRRIKSGIPVSRMLRPVGEDKASRIEWTPERVDDAVARSEYYIDVSNEATNITLERIDDAKELKARKKAREEKQKARAAGKKAKEGDVLNPDQLVQALVLALNAETLELTFPYLTLHRSCWMILRAVKEHCDPLLREKYAQGFPGRENQLQHLIQWIFMSASGSNGSQPDFRPMEAAAEAIKGMLATGAGTMAMAAVKGIGPEIEIVNILGDVSDAESLEAATKQLRRSLALSEEGGPAIEGVMDGVL